ncbi:hypothetical protein FHX05_005974 [Rhizobium sp. BK491]|nr:hypothetical protein [Rhizobium sp. BK491]
METLPNQAEGILEFVFIANIMKAGTRDIVVLGRATIAAIRYSC